MNVRLCFQSCLWLLKAFEEVNIILSVKPFNSKLQNVSNSLNRLKDVKISNREFIYVYVKRDRLDFCVNVKECLCLFVAREKPQYFYVNQFCSGV